MERKFYIVCGHYGCGKSNYSINLALDLAAQGRKVILMDLDLVNPYFLSMWELYFWLHWVFIAVPRLF